MFRVRMLCRTSIRNRGKLNSSEHSIAEPPDGILELNLPIWSCLQHYTMAVSTNQALLPSSSLPVVNFRLTDFCMQMAYPGVFSPIL